MNLIMLGAPGAGKGTQAKYISTKFNIPHISTGDIFRANIKAMTPLGMKAKEFMDQGLLVPDELVVDIVVDRLEQDDAKSGFVLDGFPRTIPQAEALEEALTNKGLKIDAAINIDTPDDLIIGRLSGRRVCLKCGATFHILGNPPKVEGICDACGDNLIQRDDDQEETIMKRLEVYHKQTQPLIDFYDTRGVLKNVNGKQSIVEAQKAIEKILEVL